MKRTSVAVCLLVGAVIVTAGCRAKPPAQSESASEEVYDVSVQDEELLPVLPAASDGQTYVVQKKDTLWSIAVEFYGDGQKWRDIAEANGIADETKLAVGMTLTIP